MTPDQPRLWPHQREAVDNICAELDSTLRHSHSTGVRATAVSACGTGKTIIGAECARRLAASGRVLVMVPTLELLTQTVRAYAAHLGVAASAFAVVCGDRTITLSVSETASGTHYSATPVTTDPGELYRWAQHGAHLIVFATYASLPVLLTAHADHRLPRWNLLVADEAHRTAGIRGRWSQVHDDRLLPAERRLYLTATPRIMTVDGSDIVSMDDPTVFGRHVFHLPFASAIDAGLLSDYRLAVVTVTDSEVAKLTGPHQVVAVGERAVPARVLAMQIALVKAIRDYGLRRVITYHGRVAAAAQFATGLPAAVELLPSLERPSHPIRAQWVAGGMTPRRRRDVVAELRNPGDSVAVVANARVLSEGMDIPALDAVMFADPRDSTTDVTQAVGRALRRDHHSDKVATVIVPIFLTEDENPHAALAGSEFDTVWRVVRALRAHDERISDYLDRYRRHRGNDSRRREIDTAPPWLHINGTAMRVGDEFHRSILLRTVTTATAPWWEHYGALLEYFTEHGHLDIPRDFRTCRGLPLGSWLAECRRLHRAARLPGDRVAALAAVDTAWCPARGWQRGIAELRRYHAQYGGEVACDYVTDEGYALGAWLATQRRRCRDGLLGDEELTELRALDIDPTDRRRRDHKHTRRWSEHLSAAWLFRTEHGHIDIPENYRCPAGRRLGTWLRRCRESYRSGSLPPERIAQLEALGVDWYPDETRWQRAFSALRDFHDRHGHSDVEHNHVTAAGFHLGAWLDAQRRRYRRGRLPARRRLQLDRLSVEWNPATAAWRTGLAALADYRRTHGTGHVPQRYLTVDGYRLGAWVTTQRRDRRNGTLAPWQIAALDELGIEWDPRTRRA